MSRRQSFLGNAADILGYNQSWVMTGDVVNPAELLKICLVSYWKLEETSGVRFDAVDGNDLTDTNTVNSAAGTVGTGAFFTAGNLERLEISPNTSLSVNGSFNVVGWIRLDVDAGATLLAKGAFISFATIEYSVQRFAAGTPFNLTLGDGVTAAILANTSSPTITTGDWFMLNAGYDDDLGIGFISINDGAVDTFAFPSPINTSSTRFSIGGTTALANYTSGTIDEVGVWCRRLSPAEITYLYNNRLGITYPFEPADFGEGAYSNGFSNGFWSAPL